MNDPKRWSETNAGADSWERQILRAELETPTPSGASAVVWSKLAAELGLAGTLVSLAAPQASASAAGAAQSGAAAQALATTGTTWIAFAKGVLVGILMSGAGWSGMQLARSTEESAPKGGAVVSAPTRSTPAPSGRSAPPEPLPELALHPKATMSRERSPSAPSALAPSPDEPRVLPIAPTSAAFEAPAEEDMTSALAEQARLLRLARTQLRNGELTSAAATLREASLRSGASMLSQEREALDIELLFRQGDHALARRRAQAFLAAHPESPHAARVRSFATP